MRISRFAALLLAALPLAACGDSPFDPELGFLAGTRENQQIGVVVNSLEKAVTLFQVADPTQTRQIPLGSSDLVTPVGFSVRGTRAAVPLGNAASVAVLDLQAQQVSRIFTVPSGNLTGSAFVDDNTVLVANLIDDYVARFTLDQAGTAIEQTVPVTPAPTEILVADGRAYVISGNLNEKYAPLGNGVVTVLNVSGGKMETVGTVEVGRNPQGAAFGPDGLLYVLNTGNWVSSGTVSVVNPRTLRVESTVENVGAGLGSIHVDRNGLAYLSGFFAGTVVYDTRARAFVRGPENPVCAKLPDGGCRGAYDAATDRVGNLYQTFFGSKDRKPYVFKYAVGSFTLTDSISAGRGPAAIELRKF